MPIQFGWSDTLHAMSTCLPCYAQASSSTDSLNNHAPNVSNSRTAGGSRIGPSHSSQSLPEALRPLLINDSTDDEYADSLSLHSNIGDSGRKKNSSRTRPRRPGVVALSETETEPDGDTTAALTRNAQKLKRRGKKKKRDHDTDGWFTVFGYHLFGKQQPAIQLPLTDDEEEDEEEVERRRRRVMRLSGSGSGTTLDSDAAPLDDAAIAAAVGRAHIVEDTAPVDSMSGAVMAAGVTAGNGDEALARHADKEERRRKRRERKEREALERALNAGFSRISSLNSFNTDEGAFEGFQGSGDGASLVALKSPPSERTSVSSKREARSGASGVDEDEEADFDGSIYARLIPTDSSPLKTSESRTTTSTATRSSHSTPAPSSRRSGRLSHHHSQSNVSSNDAADEYHEDMFNTSSIHPRETSSNNTEDRKKKKLKIRSKPSPLAPSSTATSSQSPSLPSPPGSAALGPGLSTSLSMPPSSSQTYPNVTMPTKNTNAKSETVPRLGPEDPFLIAPREPTSANGLDGLGSNNRGFPSVGFGRRNSTHLNGAFLARRGD